MPVNHKKDSPLLPVRHPEKDFFIADIFDNLAFKDDMASMEHPMFSLSKNKDLRAIKYERNGISVEISPNAQHGLPTIFDKDVLLYCGSLLMEQVNKGIIPLKTLRFSTHDLLVTTNRPTNGEAYKNLEKALKRLTGVMITTNIKTNEIEQSEGFHLVDSYHFIKSDFSKERRVGLEITLSDWFYNSIIGKEVLTISRDYFRLGKATERRLYEIARKQCGKQKQCAIGLKILKDKAGSTGSLRKFRFFIRQIAEDNFLPDYEISLSSHDVVTFKNRRFVKTLPGEPRGYEDLPHISDQALRKAEQIVMDSGTGWSFHAIREQYTEELINGFDPKNVNGAFINFVKSKVRTRP